MPAEHSVELELAVLADGFTDRLRRLPQSIRDLARVHDAGDGWHDPLPTLYSALSIAHFADESEHEHRKLLDEVAGDMTLGRGADQRDVGGRRGAARRAELSRALSHRPNAIPQQSTSTSTGSESRPGTKLWWTSSLIA